MTAREFLPFMVILKIDHRAYYRANFRGGQPFTCCRQANTFYSSGMKQRLKLAQAIFSDVPAVFLDEPCTNLDADGYALYYKWIEKYSAGRLVLISSNDRNEYHFCEHELNILDFKNSFSILLS
jgi:ABC-type lipoprotein export system ATPase subunit